MTRLARTLIAGTAILILPLNLAYADGSTDTSTSDILNGQVNLTNAWSNTNMTVDGVNGNVSGQSVSAGNAASIVTFNNTSVHNDQYSSSYAIGSDLNANITNVNGSVGLTTQTACNSIDVSTDPAYTAVGSTQQCAAQDPSQLTNATIGNVAGDVSIMGSSVGNSFSEDTNANTVNTNVTQLNQAAINSTTNALVQNVGGNVAVSSAAIGNNVQIIHY